MEYAIINFLLYFLALCVYFFYKKQIDVGFVLFSTYALVSLACILHLSSEENQWKLNMWSFIYLFAIVILFLRPFLKKSNFSSLTQINNIKFLRLFVYLFILCTVIDVFFSLETTLLNLKEGDWRQLRRNVYSDEVILYNNQILRFARIFLQYLKPLAIVIFFISLTKKILSFNIQVLLFLSILLPSFIISIITASRGIIFSTFSSLIFGFIFFKKAIPKELKKYIYIIGSFVLFAIIYFSLEVTNSRFGENNSSNNFIYYFGHSMLVFNYGLSDSIIEFGYGAYFFDWFYNLFGIDTIDINKLGAHFGTQFYTFVGALYIDFGPVFTFLIALIAPLFFSNILRKNKLYVADYFILLVYINFLFMGVFVTGKGTALLWLISIIIYKYLKIKKI